MAIVRNKGHLLSRTHEWFKLQKQRTSGRRALSIQVIFKGPVVGGGMAQISGSVAVADDGETQPFTS